MGKRETDYPHTISFRVTDETRIAIQKEIAGSNLTPHEWCRQAALDRLTKDYGLSKGERLLLFQSIRVQYLLTQAFQLLADNNLTGEHWKETRANARHKTAELTNQMLASSSDLKP